MSDGHPLPPARPRAAQLLRDYVQADADRRAMAGLPEHRRSPEAIHEAMARATEAHQAWQAELRNAEAGQ
jgi:hypothetical protein